MKKKNLLVASLASTMVVASLAAVVGLHVNSKETIKADPENLSLTFEKGHNQNAITSKGNTVHIIERYSGDFTFDAEDTYFAKNENDSNSFLGLDENTLVQKITSITVNYTNTPDIGEGHVLSITLRSSFSWSDSTRAYISNPVSGKKYTLDDPEVDYIWCTSATTFRYFCIQDYRSYAAITSIVLEYACE